MPEEPTRQLAAIMFADIVGYTALMQEDEGRAHLQRDRHRALLSAAVDQHHGEILQYYGDGTLTIFPSAVEAVQCAVQIQLSLREEELIPLRIGVHTGDIVHDQDGVYGDGVNVASRIEGLAAPGGVMISGKVYDEIKNHPSIPTVSLGEVHLKNVEHPASVFAISSQGLTVPSEEYVREKAGGGSVAPGSTSGERSRLGGRRERGKLSGLQLVLAACLVAVAGGTVAVLGLGDREGDLSDTAPRPTLAERRERPVIAVLPFLNGSAQEEEDAAFLATGLHDELLTQLSKIASVDVIARTSVMQYAGTEKTVRVIGRELGVHTVLEGTLMRAGDQVRLNVQLIDAQTDTHLWAETYDREFTVANVFDIQSDLARQVVLALKGELAPAEQALISEVPTRNMDAYTLYLRGLEALDRPGWEPLDLETARSRFADAVEEDPEFALAHAWLSMAHGYEYLYYDRRQTRLAQARDAAEEALRLNPQLPEGHLAKAFHHFQRYENDEAALALALAEEGLPGSRDVVALKGELLVRQRDWDGALEARERAAYLDPLNAEAGVDLAVAYAERGRWEEANATFDRVLEIHPTFFEAAFIRGWFTWRRTGDGGPGLAALARIPPDVDVFGLRAFFEWLMTGDREGRIAALEKIDQPTADFGGFWWAPRALLEGWTYRGIDPARAERAFEEAVDVSLEALELAPDDARIHASLGRAYAALGLREAAVREAERVVDILPMSVDPSFGRELLEIVAHIYAELGMAEEAADALEEVFSVPVVPPLVDILGPDYDMIRDHPRIRALIEGYGAAVPKRR